MEIELLYSNDPCRGGACIGVQSCEYGVSGNYGEVCAIDVVVRAADYYAASER